MQWDYGRVLRKQRQQRRLGRNCQAGKRTESRKLRGDKGFLRDWWSGLINCKEKMDRRKEKKKDG